MCSFDNILCVKCARLQSTPLAPFHFPFLLVPLLNHSFSLESLLQQEDGYKERGRGGRKRCHSKQENISLLSTGQIFFFVSGVGAAGGFEKEMESVKYGPRNTKEGRKENLRDNLDLTDKGSLGEEAN